MTLEEAYQSLLDFTPETEIKSLIKTFILKHLPSGVKKPKRERKKIVKVPSIIKGKRDAHNLKEEFDLEVSLNDSGLSLFHKPIFGETSQGEEIITKKIDKLGDEKKQQNPKISPPAPGRRATTKPLKGLKITQEQRMEEWPFQKRNSLGARWRVPSAQKQKSSSKNRQRGAGWDLARASSTKEEVSLDNIKLVRIEEEDDYN